MQLETDKDDLGHAFNAQEEKKVRTLGCCYPSSLICFINTLQLMVNWE